MQRLVNVTDQMQQPYQIVGLQPGGCLGVVEHPAEFRNAGGRIRRAGFGQRCPIRREGDIHVMPVAVFAQVLIPDVQVGVGTLGSLAIVDVARLMLDGIRPGGGPQECDDILLVRRDATHPARVVRVQAQQFAGADSGYRVKLPPGHCGHSHVTEIVPGLCRCQQACPEEQQAQRYGRPSAVHMWL